MSVTVEKCLQAWSNSLRQMKSKADIVFFGDSLTYYGDFASVFPDKVVCNLGLQGDTIQGMIDRVEQVKMLEPKQVFLMAGINDVTNCTAESFGRQYETLVLKLKELLPDASIVIQSMLPVNDRDFLISCNNEQIMICNNYILNISAKNEIRFMDLFIEYVNSGGMPQSLTIDGIHLNSFGYNKWYKLLLNMY
jgi:lysophospholipase L1-like esterase